MSRNLGLTGVLFALATLASGSASGLEAQRPNVILILADDLGSGDLSCYGGRSAPTPHLDRMAAEGVRFETFFAMPLCTPTRLALMTGQYGFHNGYLGMANQA